MESKIKQAQRINEEYQQRLDGAMISGSIELARIIKRQAFSTLFELACSLSGNKGGRAKETHRIVMDMADKWSH